MFTRLLLKWTKAEQLPPPKWTRRLLILAGILTVLLTMALLPREFHDHDSLLLALAYVGRDFLLLGLIFFLQVFMFLMVIYNPVRAVLSIAVTIRDEVSRWRS